MEQHQKSAEDRKEKRKFHLPKLKISKKSKNNLETLAPFIRQLISLLERDGVGVEGILRISGSITKIQNLQKSILKGDGLDGRLIDDIHVAAGLFKSLLRELSEPLIPFSAYSALVDRNEEMKQMNVRLKVFKTILSNIPSLNRQVIEEIMRLAQKIALNAATRMNPRNLAVVLGPTIMRARDESLEEMMTVRKLDLDAPKVIETVCEIIQHWDEVSPSATGTIISLPPVALPEPELSSPRDVDDSSRQRKLIEFQRRCDELEQRLQDELTQRSVLEAALTTMEKKLHSEQEKSEMLADQLKQQEELSQLSAREREAQEESEVSRLKLEAARWKEAVLRLESDMQSLRKEYGEVQSDLLGQREALRSCEATSSALEAELAAKKSELESVQNSHTNRLELLHAENAALKSRAATQEAALLAQSEQLKDKDTKISQCEKTIRELTQQFSSSSNDVKRLTRELELSSQQNKKLSDDLSKSSSEKSTLEREWIQLKSKLAGVESQLAKLQSANTSKEVDDSRAAENAELHYHLFLWMCLSIKLDLLSRGTYSANMDKADVFKQLEEEKVPIASWPARILAVLDPQPGRTV